VLAPTATNPGQSWPFIVAAVFGYLTGRHFGEVRSVWYSLAAVVITALPVSMLLESLTRGGFGVVFGLYNWFVYVLYLLPVVVLPWLFGRRGQDDSDGDTQTDAPAEDNDKWMQGDLSGVPASADQQHLATWRPEKVVPGSGPAEEVVYRSSGAMPPPQPEPEPEPAADAAADETEEEEPERTSADLLDRRSEQWDTRGSDLPGVLG